MAEWVAQNESPSVSATSRMRTAYLEPVRRFATSAICTYIEQSPGGEEATLAALLRGVVAAGSCTHGGASHGVGCSETTRANFVGRRPTAARGTRPRLPRRLDHALSELVSYALSAQNSAADCPLARHESTRSIQISSLVMHESLGLEHCCRQDVARASVTLVVRMDRSKRQDRGLGPSHALRVAGRRRPAGGAHDRSSDQHARLAYPLRHMGYASPRLIDSACGRTWVGRPDSPRGPATCVEARIRGARVWRAVASEVASRP